MGFNLDLKNDTKQSLDAPRVGLGWYRATIEDVHVHNESGNLQWTFRILGPTCVGGSFIDFLNDPELQNSEKGVNYATQRAKRWAARLGLLADTDYGQSVEPAWESAIGKEVVIRIKDGSYTPAGSTKLVEKLELDYAPFPLDSDSIPAAERVRLGLPVLPGQSIESAKVETPAKKRKTREAAAAGAANGAGSTPQQFDVSDL